MMKFFLFLFLLTAGIYATAQPLVQWQKSYGGGRDDHGNAIAQTTDGGYITAGYSNSNNADVTGNKGQYDYWVVKLSDTGAIMWKRSLGGTSQDMARSVKQTRDGGYILAGLSGSNDSDVSGHHGDTGYLAPDYWVVKLSATGSIQWQKSLGGGASDAATCIIQTYDGGYMVAGSSYSYDGDVTGHHGSTSPDMWLVKLDDTGHIEWQRSLGGGNDEEAAAVIQTRDSGYAVTGFTSSTDGDVTGKHGPAGTQDVWVVKLSRTGDITWQKCFGGTGYDYGTAIRQTPDGGYAVSGMTESTDGDVTVADGILDFWLLKLSDTGGLQWQKSMGGAVNDEANDVVTTRDSGFIVAGLTLSHDIDVTGNRGVRNTWLTKVSATGDMIWEKCLGGSDHEDAQSIVACTDGGYICAGSSSSHDGDVTENLGGYDYWVIKFYDPATTRIAREEAAAVNGSAAIWPNPTKGEIIVKGTGIASIKVYNSLGTLVAKTAGVNSLSIAPCAAGMYFVTVTDATGAVLMQGKIWKE